MRNVKLFLEFFKPCVVRVLCFLPLYVFYFLSNWNGKGTRVFMMLHKQLNAETLTNIAQFVKIILFSTGRKFYNCCNYVEGRSFMISILCAVIIVRLHQHWETPSLFGSYKILSWENRELKHEDFSRWRRGEIHEGLVLTSSFSRRI